MHGQFQDTKFVTLSRRESSFDGITTVVTELPDGSRVTRGDQFLIEERQPLSKSRVTMT